MKKLLLGLGTIAAVVSPVAAVVACGTSGAKPTNPNPGNPEPGKAGPTNTEPTNTGPTNTVVPVVPGTNKGAVDHKDVTTKNVLTDSDKELTSTLYEDQLTGFTSSNTFKHGLDAIADIEIDYGVQFSDNSKKILAPDTHVTYNDQYDSSKKELKITMFSDTNPSGGEEFVFHITFKQVQGIETTLSQTELDDLSASDFNTVKSVLDIDNKLGTKLNDGKYKDYDYFNFIGSSKIIELHKGDPLRVRFKLLPKTTVVSTTTKTGLEFPVSDGQYILDVEDSPTLSRTDLESAFNKFSADIDLSSKSSLYGSLGTVNHPELDVTKDHFKVMVVGTDTDHTSITFRVGLIGLDKNSGELCLSWRAASSASDISDAMTKGDVVTEILGPQLPGFGSPINAMTIGVSDTAKVSNFLKEVIKSIPAFAGKTVAI